MKRVYLLLLLLLSLSGCSYSSYTASIIDNNIQFKQTKSPLSPNAIDVNEQYYQDEYISVRLNEVTENSIFLTLTNNHNSTIRILWDEAAFVDFQGYSHRVNHDGSGKKDFALAGEIQTKSEAYSSGESISGSSHSRVNALGRIVDTDDAQTVTIIPSEARINTVIEPVANNRIIRYINIKEVKYRDELGSTENAQNAFNAYRSKVESTTVKLLLPLEVDGEKMEYTFILRDEFQMSHQEFNDEASGAVLLGLLPLIVIFLVI